MKKFTRIMAGLWLLGVLAIGVGGTWLTHNPGALVGEPLLGKDEAPLAEKRMQARLRREERKAHVEAGWGDGAARGEGGDWGKP